MASSSSVPVVQARTYLLGLNSDVVDSTPIAAVSSAAANAANLGFLGRLPHLAVKLIAGLGAVLEWFFGLATLLAGLSFLASLPLVQFLSLGYLLESGARVARSGRLRDGFIGIGLAARLGKVGFAAWLLFLPSRALAELVRAGTILSLDEAQTSATEAPETGWRVVLFVLLTFTFLHLLAACARGGQIRHFVWPFTSLWLFRQLFQVDGLSVAWQSCRQLWNLVVSLGLPRYWWLGLRGFFGAAIWLVGPVTLLALGRFPGPAGVVLGWLGALFLATVLLYLPFLQMHLASTNRFSAIFEIWTVRAKFRRAPWLFSGALIVTLLSALPLYLLKIEMLPREAAWLPSLVFIAFMFPARLLTGWALARAERRQDPRHWAFRWSGRLPMLPVVVVYVLIVYFSQFTSWHGVWSLYEQHAFLVPVPFFG